MKEREKREERKSERERLLEVGDTGGTMRADGAC